VEFFVDGVLKRTERFAPYSLFGDNGSGKELTGTFGTGPHVLRAVATAVGGQTEDGTLSLTEGQAPSLTLEERVALLEAQARLRGWNV